MYYKDEEDSYLTLSRADIQAFVLDAWPVWEVILKKELSMDTKDIAFLRKLLAFGGCDRFLVDRKTFEVGHPSWAPRTISHSLDRLRKAGVMDREGCGDVEYCDLSFFFTGKWADYIYLSRMCNWSHGVKLLQVLPDRQRTVVITVFLCWLREVADCCGRWEVTPPKLTAEVIKALIETLRVYSPDDVCYVIEAFGVALLTRKPCMTKMTDILVFLGCMPTIGVDLMEEAFKRILTEMSSVDDDEQDSYGEWYGAA